MITRSTPAKAENGPAWSMVAMLTRQSKPSMPAPSGQAAISRVVPPPFFQGAAASEAVSKRWIRTAGPGYLIIGRFSPCFFAVAMAMS